MYVPSRAEQCETEQSRQIPPVAGHIVVVVLTLTHHCHYLVSGNRTGSNHTRVAEYLRKQKYEKKVINIPEYSYPDDTEAEASRTSAKKQK